MNSSSGHIVATAVEAIPIQGVNTTPLNYAYNSNNNNQQNQAISSSVPVQPVSNVNEGGAREFLTANKWPVGLQDCLLDHLNRIPIRFFICDDSGSMIENDGHKLVTSANGQNRLIPCSRWSELTESLKFHASLSNAACIPRLENTV